MNETLGTYMKLAATTIVIAGLVFGALLIALKGEAGDYRTHLRSNTNTMIQDVMSNP